MEGSKFATEAQLCDLLNLNRRTLLRMRRAQPGKQPLLVAGVDYLQPSKGGHLLYVVSRVVQRLAARSRALNSPLA